MNPWGYPMIAIGGFFVTCGVLKSDFFLYRIFVAKAERFWRENVHKFLGCSGIAIMIVGIIMLLGVI